MKMKFVLFLLPLVFSLDVHSANKYIDDFKKKVEEQSTQLNISPESFVGALDSYRRLKHGNENNDATILPLGSFPEVQKAMSYINAGDTIPHELEKRLQGIINSQQAKIATQLGLDVRNLSLFFKGMNKFSPPKNESSSKEGRERVTIKCRDFCRKGSIGLYQLNLTIWDAATDANIPQFTPFEVEFVDRDTGQIAKKEIWKYDNFYGAYKEGDAPGDYNSDL